MTGSNLVVNALKNTSKGKLTYKRNLESLEKEVSFDYLKMLFY